MEVLTGKSIASTASSEQTSVNDDDDDWHVEALLGPEYLAPVRTVYALADVIIDRRHTSRLMQELQRFSPIPSLKHLKRVCPDGRILIRLADDISELKSSNNASFSNDRVLLPPEKCVETGKKRSFSETTTEPSLPLQNGLSNTKNVLSVRNVSVSSSQETSLCDESDDKGPVSCEKSSNTTSHIGAHPSQESKYRLPVGLNPEGLRGCLEQVPVPATAPLTRSQFLEAQRIWSCNFHPTHSVEAALSQGAGLKVNERKVLLTAWRHCRSVIQTTGAKCAAAAVEPQDGHILALAIDKREVHPLQHAAMRLVDLVARTQGGGVWPHLPEEIVTEIRNDSAHNNGAYLCTGLDIVMTQEPCAMCAMALTHARARRLFFTEDNPQGGVLFSHSPPLHILPGLNHRLRVFRARVPNKDNA